MSEMMKGTCGSLSHGTWGRQLQRARLDRAELLRIADTTAAARGRCCELRDSIRRRRMRREEHVDRARIALLRLTQRLEQLDHPAPVPSGLRHDLQSDSIRLALIVPGEFQEHAVGHHRARRLRIAQFGGLLPNRRVLSATYFDFLRDGDEAEPCEPADDE